MYKEIVECQKTGIITDEVRGMLENMGLMIIKCMSYSSLEMRDYCHKIGYDSMIDNFFNFKSEEKPHFEKFDGDYDEYTKNYFCEVYKRGLAKGFVKFNKQ